MTRNPRDELRPMVGHYDGTVLLCVGLSDWRLTPTEADELADELREWADHVRVVADNY